MRRVALLLCSVLLASTGFAQTLPFSADFASGGKLRMHVRSAEVHILGTSEEKITVEVSGRKAYDAGDIRVRMKEVGGATDLKISGGPRNDITLTIRVPKNTDLYARIPFGEVHVENVTGNKDISVHAGDVTVWVGNPSDYSRVEASVTTGELEGGAFGEEHGGLFRSFKRNGSGKYRLYAHVGAGQLTLQ